MENYNSLFADEASLTRRHRRFDVFMLVFIGLSVLLFSSGAGYFSALDLQQRIERRNRCDEHTYPWDYSPGYQAPFASREECREHSPLLEGEARDFGLFALAGGSIALALLFAGARLRNRVPQALRILRERAHEVVWAYIVQIDGTPDRSVIVRTKQGDVELLNLNDPLQCNEVMRRIAVLCPQAILGYSEETARLFQ